MFVDIEVTDNLKRMQASRKEETHGLKGQVDDLSAQFLNLNADVSGLKQFTHR